MVSVVYCSLTYWRFKFLELTVPTWFQNLFCLKGKESLRSINACYPSFNSTIIFQPSLNEVRVKPAITVSYIWNLPIILGQISHMFMSLTSNNYKKKQHICPFWDFLSFMSFSHPVLSPLWCIGATIISFICFWFFW